MSLKSVFWLICAALSFGLILSQRDSIEEHEWTLHREQPSAPSVRDFAGCHFEGNTYSDGQRMTVSDPCIHCFCLKGKAKCFRQNCPMPPQGCQLFPSNADSCSSSVYNCSIPEKHQTPLLRRGSKMYGQRHHGSGFVQADCLIRGIAYLVGETVGVASSSCLQCKCAKRSLLCIPLCCYEPILTNAGHRQSRDQLEQSFHRSVHQRDPHPLEHLQ